MLIKVICVNNSVKVWLGHFGIHIKLFDAFKILILMVNRFLEIILWFLNYYLLGIILVFQIGTE